MRHRPVSAAQRCGRAYYDIPHSLVLRSPWSNEYHPPLADGTVPSAKLRKLEVQANDAFDTYREMLVYFKYRHGNHNWVLGTTKEEFRRSFFGISMKVALRV